MALVVTESALWTVSACVLGALVAAEIARD
jgi:hypothetical protein